MFKDAVTPVLEGRLRKAYMRQDVPSDPNQSSLRSDIPTSSRGLTFLANESSRMVAMIPPCTIPS